MNETTTNPDSEYDPEKDPTPEDGEITPRDELIIELETLRKLDAMDFNLWRSKRFPNFVKLIEQGIEREDGTVFLPTPEPPPMPSGYDNQGFSIETSHNCVQYENFRKMGELLAKSGNRILEFLGEAVLPHQWYLLPIDRFDGDEAFQLAYLKNTTCRPQEPLVTGRSGFINKSVYLNITEEPVRIGSREVIQYHGLDPIENHHQPISHRDLTKLKENIERLFLDRFRLGGPGWEGYIRHAANSLFNQDRMIEERWEHYQAPPAGLEFDREIETNQARDQLKALQRHLD